MQQADAKLPTFMATVGPIEQMEGVPTCLVAVSARVVASDAAQSLQKLTAAILGELKT